MLGIADAVTAVRLVLSPALFLLEPFSAPFYGLYILCGLTDMADGYIARKTHTQSSFGAKLDSIADFVFVAICLIRLLPAITVKPWLWAFPAIILTVKLTNLVCGLVLFKKLCFLHTAANKVTGLMLFVLPLTVPLADIHMAAVPVCLVALFAAVQEGHFIRTEKQDHE